MPDMAGQIGLGSDLSITPDQDHDAVRKDTHISTHR